MATDNSHVVLIVDDDKYTRESVRELVLSWHIETDDADSGAIAIEKMKNRKYSLVLLDMRMDNMDGLDVLEEIKKLNIKAPIMLMTAYPHDERVERALKYDICLCLVKPVGPAGLKKVVERFIKI